MVKVFYEISRKEKSPFVEEGDLYIRCNETDKTTEENIFNSLTSLGCEEVRQYSYILNIPEADMVQKMNEFGYEMIPADDIYPLSGFTTCDDKDLIYWNMDQSLIKQTDLVAPKISRQELINKVKALYSPRNDGISDDVISRILINIFDDFNNPIYKELAEQYGVYADDLDFINVYMGENGVPYLFLCVMSDEDIAPLYLMLYWNGKNIQSYVPMYGNTIDAVNKCPIGAGESNCNVVIEKNGIIQTISFDNEEEFSEYCEELFCCEEETEVCVNFDACKEDFSYAITGF